MLSLVFADMFREQLTQIDVVPVLVLRRVSIFEAFMMPSVSTMPSSLLQLPVTLSANKFAIPIDNIIKARPPRRLPMCLQHA